MLYLKRGFPAPFTTEIIIGDTSNQPGDDGKRSEVKADRGQILNFESSIKTWPQYYNAR